MDKSAIFNQLMPSAASSGNPMLDTYDTTRARFYSQQDPSARTASMPLSSSHGFMQTQEQSLTTVYSGFDKVFHQLMLNIVEDLITPTVKIQKFTAE